MSDLVRSNFLCFSRSFITSSFCRSTIFALQRREDKGRLAPCAGCRLRDLRAVGRGGCRQFIWVLCLEVRRWAISLRAVTTRVDGPQGIHAAARAALRFTFRRVPALIAAQHPRTAAPWLLWICEGSDYGMDRVVIQGACRHGWANLTSVPGSHGERAAPSSRPPL